MKKYYLVSMFFLIFITVFCVINISISVDDWSVILMDETNNILKKISMIEFKYNEKFYKKNEFIEVYGLTQYILHKNQINNFSIYKDKNGKLVQPSELKSNEEIESMAYNISELYNYLDRSDIPMLYVSTSLPVSENERTLPMGVKDYSNDNTNMFLEKLSSMSIPYLDLRLNSEIRELKSDKSYYLTDHHWSIENCFMSYKIVIDKLNLLYDLKLDPINLHSSLSNYNKIIYNDALLGSYGIKVGKYYAGKDDFSIYIPKFKTSLSYKHIKNGEVTLEKSGNFYEAFINEELLLDKEYNNKYNVFLNGGYVENIIENHLSDNNKKVLLISNSFGRAFTQYLSLCFEETRYLDPQKGRYNGNYLEYIDEYNPDVVIVMFEAPSYNINID